MTLIIYQVFKPEIPPTTKTFLLYAFFIPYAFLKGATVVSFIRTSDWDKSLIEFLKAVGLYLALFHLPLWLASSGLSELVKNIEEFFNLLLSSIDKSVPISIITLAFSSYAFSTFMDTGKSGEDPLLHSFLAILGVFMLFRFLPLATSYTYLDALSFLLLTCGIFHILEDVIGKEGAQFLYPFSRKSFLKDFIGRKEVLEKSERAVGALIIFIFFLAIVVTIFKGLNYINPLQFFTALTVSILLPTPFLLLKMSLRRPESRVLVGLKPLRCPNCGRIIPARSEVCPYCGYKVR